jgi:predicted  nucleic acid-binding Zn-ribbon protein
MTFLGKIFTVLVLCLSLLFFFVALAVNASHIKHKTKLAAYQTQAKQLETTIDELKKRIEELQTARTQEIASRRLALAAVQTQLDTAKEQLLQANKELNDKAATLTAQTQQLGEAHERVAILNRQNDSLKADLDKIIADRNDQRRRVISLTDQLHGLQSVEQDLKASIAQLQRDATFFQAKSETQAAALKTAGVRDPEDVPPAGLRGEVLHVGNDKSVVVSIGKDDGLREGHKLEVYRGAQYLGRIQIRTTKDDQATGTILTSFQKGYIQAGDKVAARVN